MLPRHTSEQERQRGKWFGGGVLVALLCVLFYNALFSSGAMVGMSSVMGAEANSATGRLFSGAPIRTFSGSLKLQGAVTSSKKKSFGGITCKKWAVVTTIFQPSAAVRNAGALEDWCLVVVGDKKTPPDYAEKVGIDSTKGVFLSAADQKRMAADGDNFIAETPWNHFARKNIGYLYAIQHGAELIFDFDDDNELFLGKDGKPIQPVPSSEVFNGVSLDVPLALNPYPNMGAEVPNAWPRGFPLERLNDVTSIGVPGQQTSVPMSKVAVVQLLANHDPDVDAVFRLTKKVPFNFRAAEDSASHNVLLPLGKFAPYNAQATVHTKAGLWAIYLPITVQGRVSDIWRGYFAETIFTKYGLQLAFVPPRVQQIRNVHNYLADMDAEADLYFKTGELLNFLVKWRAEEDTRQAAKSVDSSVPAEMERLWVALYERSYIEIKDVELIQSWLLALVEAGYEFPVKSTL